MKQNELDEIIKTAEEKYDGDIETAIAAHIYTPGTVAKCGGKVPPYADMRKIGGTKGLITRHKSRKAEKAAKAKAEKAAKAKAEKAAKAKAEKAAKAKATAKKKTSKTKASKTVKNDDAKGK